MDRPEAAEMLYTAEHAGRTAREARRAFWFPLVVFGVITLLSSPLYRLPPPHGSSPRLISQPLGAVSLFAGGWFLRDPALVSLFWVLALPFGYAATVVYYRDRARRRGIAAPVGSYVAVGIALLAFLVVTSLTTLRSALPGDLVVRGLTPLLTIALGLFVLAWAERSGPLVGFAAGFMALALLLALYNVENVFYRIGVGVPAPAINVIIAGAVLLLGGAVFWVGDRQAG